MNRQPEPIQLMIADPLPAGSLVEAPAEERVSVRCYFCSLCGAIHQENEPEYSQHRKHADGRGVWRRTCIAIRKEV